MRGQESYGVQATVISWDSGCTWDHSSPQPATRAILWLHRYQHQWRCCLPILMSAGSAVTMSMVPAPWSAARGLRKTDTPLKVLQRILGAHGYSPNISDTGKHHKRKGPEQEPKVSPLCVDVRVAGKQMESKVIANSQVVPMCFVKPAWQHWSMEHISVKPEEINLKPNSCPQRDFHCVHKVNLPAVD